jgi:hypothetical protein
MPKVPTCVGTNIATERMNDSILLHFYSALENAFSLARNYQLRSLTGKKEETAETVPQVF